MQQVQGGKFSQALQRLFGSQGKLSLQLDSVIVPTISLGSLEEEAEGGRLCVGSCLVPAGGAGNRSIIQLNLPSANAGQFGVEIRLERAIIYSPTTAAQMTLQWGRSPGVTAPNVNGTTRFRDTSLRGFPSAVLQGKNNAPVPGGVPQEAIAVLQPNQQLLFLDLDWRLAPGDTNGFLLWCGTSNEALRVTFYWREIPPS